MVSQPARASHPRASLRTVLRGLVVAGASGELVCATDTNEAHLFLQGGRIAWGTDSAHPLAFGHRLMALCQLDQQRFAELVRTCRRDRRPLGEALVAGRLASREQVREALRHQAMMAVRHVWQLGEAHSEFFERSGFSSYDASLTFTLDELLAPSDALTSVLGQEVAGCVWAERWRDDHCAVRDANRGAPQAPGSLVRAVSRQGADFVAARNGSGAVLGAAIAGSSESLWCAIDDGAGFGAAYAVLGRLCQLERHVVARPAPRVCTPRIIHDRGQRLTDTSLALLRRAEQVLAVCHLVNGEPTTLVAREGCAEACSPATLQARFEAAFAHDVLPPCAPGGLGTTYGLRTTVFGEAGLWSFGAELATVTSESLWLLTSRHTAQGFGWACLGALVRELERS